MSGKIYVSGGKVRSQYDDDLHHVSAEQVRRLYGVPRNRCTLINHERPRHRVRTRFSESDVLLIPQSSGNYELPDKAKDILSGG